MIKKEDIDNSFKYYNLDDKYKDRCYKCIDNINSNKSFLESFNKINNLLNNSGFKVIRKLWKYKDVNELFCEKIDPFVTNIIILLSYKTSQENIRKYNLDNEQININIYRIKECFESDLINRNYESVRISQMLWAYYFARVRIIEVGRLQYQYSITDDNKQVIKIHIPRGNKLDISSVRKSIDDSKQEIKKVFKVSDCEYICNSWLLSNQIHELVDKDTNIYKFQELFNVKDGESCIDDILNFVYQKKDINNYSELQEDTSLQKIIKNELLNGTAFNVGKGVLKDINNINYRKAQIKDLNDISSLVTNLLGTCNINNSSANVSRDDIFNDNKEEIKKDIDNYYVCEINNHIVGACGISEIKHNNNYNLNLKQYREILYLVVDNNYQRKGIGTKLLQLCCNGIKDTILYEAWGDKEEVNSKYLLKKCGFTLLKDLGDTYYKDNGYCMYCVNRNKKCNKCKAELWIKK